MASVERHGSGFRVVWREGGVKHRRSFATEPDARSFAARVSAASELTKGVSPLFASMLGRTDSRTVVDFARPLVDDVDLGPSSRDIYAQALRKIEGSRLATLPLHEVRPSDVREFMNDVVTDRRNVHQFLAKVFNAAVRD